MKPQPGVRSIIFGGVIPLILFTVIEEKYGVVAGLCVGMVFGVGEVCYEFFRFRKVERMTWIGNGLILVLGGISLLTAEGIWFKLQPAIIEALFAGMLFGSVILKKPLLVFMSEKQGVLAQLRPEHSQRLKKSFSGLTFRLGIFMLLHAALATYAAFYWTTRAWMILKGVGFTGSMVLYMLIEIYWIRKRM